MITGIPTGDGDFITTTKIEESQDSNNEISGSNETETYTNTSLSPDAVLGRSDDTTLESSSDSTTNTSDNTTPTGADNPFNLGYGGGTVDEATDTGSGDIDSVGGVENITTTEDQTPTNAFQEATGTEGSTTNMDLASLANLEDTIGFDFEGKRVNQVNESVTNTTETIRDIPNQIPQKQSVEELTDRMSEFTLLKVVSLIGGIGAFLALIAAALRGN